jgi:hypothetical protein
LGVSITPISSAAKPSPARGHAKTMLCWHIATGKAMCGHPEADVQLCIAWVLKQTACLACHVWARQLGEGYTHEKAAGTLWQHVLSWHVAVQQEAVLVDISVAWYSYQQYRCASFYYEAGMQLSDHPLHRHSPSTLFSQLFTAMFSTCSSTARQQQVHNQPPNSTFCSFIDSNKRPRAA